MSGLDRSQKLVIGTASLLGVIATLWGFHRFLGTHLEVHLMPRAEADTRRELLIDQIHAATDAAMQAAGAAQITAAALEQHVALESLAQSRARVDILREQLSSTQLWEKANGGENDVSRARKRDLDNQLERTRDYIACREAARFGCSLAPTP